MHDFLSNPLIVFLLFGFGAWILFILIASIFSVKTGQWIDRQLEDEE